MQPLEIPKFPVLRGKKAINALYDFINELEEQKGNELTEKQTKALIKLAEGLISTITAEAQSGTSYRNTKKMRSATASNYPSLLLPTRATLNWYALPEIK